MCWCSSQYGNFVTGNARPFVTYASTFNNLSILWGMVFDGWKPDRFDLIGTAIALIGVSIIMWERQIFR